MSITKLNPFKAVSFKESTVAKIIEKTGMIAAIKYDGIRVLLVIKPMEDINGKPAACLYAMSRTDKAIPALSQLYSTPEDQLVLGQFLNESLYPDGIVLDGEMMVKGVPFEASSGILRRKTPVDIARLEYMLYGVLPLAEMEGTDTIEIPYAVMYEQCRVVLLQLKELFPSLDWYHEETYEVYDMESLFALYEIKRKEGFEGLIAKDPLGFYKRGKKTGYFKLKPENTIDGLVMAVNWGTDGLSNEGKVIGFEVLLEDGTVVNANGITQAQMNEFTHLVNEHGEEHFDAWQCEISFMERTAKGGLRHPSFLKWRGLEGSETIKA